MFAFSSLGGSIDSRTYKSIYVFKLHGQLYHFVPDLIADDDKVPKLLQLYFYDAQYEKDLRSNLFPEIRPDVISLLMEIMDCNPYAQFFQSLRDINVHENTRIFLNKSSSLDQRVYNAPSSSEVAAIWIDDFPSDDSTSPYIAVCGKSNKSHRIYHYYGSYDPLQYPLLFPSGDCGWHQGIRKCCNGVRKSMCTCKYPISPLLAIGK
ncbi:uncharacterized protein LOC130812729 [Amaranthus tricolor]|uniref:uncharacterized protein LOC130812729 n=1 Tax=Amaranthus tricolor TaxID=29722 RepID=UPI00258A109D|nr:uncharacterized protein LOC130812729 [Amaranthus tricolor]XP_057534286.1 uncharacterized protein LOC130812729 [Amaranthus tricolor]